MGLADEGELTGASVVAWMVERGWASSVCEAVIIGARMVQRGLLEAVDVEVRGFHNEKIRYRLVGRASSDVAEQREAGNRDVAEILELPVGQIAAEIGVGIARARGASRRTVNTERARVPCPRDRAHRVVSASGRGAECEPSRDGLLAAVRSRMAHGDDETARHDEAARAIQLIGP